MGYYLKNPVAVSRNLTAPVPFVRPKTHTLCPQLQERGQRYCNPETGRWLSRDPIGEEGGINSYESFVNNPLNLIDVNGEYPGTPHHGLIVPPDESVSLVGGLQVDIDHLFDDNLNHSFGMYRRWKSKWRNAIRLIAIHEAIDDSDGNRFVYTCKYGWIDHAHFYNSAMGVYLGSQVMTRWNASAAAIGIGYFNEFLQEWHFLRIADVNSAWTPEDLISNRLGRDMARQMIAYDNVNLLSPSLPFQQFPASRFYDIADNWTRQLHAWGAVKWNTWTKQWLDEDLAAYQQHPRHDIYSVAGSRAYYRSTLTWKCLCAGNQAILPSDRY